MTLKSVISALNTAINESSSVRSRELYAETMEDFSYSQTIILSAITEIKSLAIELSSNKGIAKGTTIEKLCKEILEEIQ